MAGRVLITYGPLGLRSAPRDRCALITASPQLNCTPQPLRTVPRLDHRNWCLGQLDQFLLSDDLDTDSTSQSVQALLEFKTGATDAQMVNAIVHHSTGMCCDQTRELRVCRGCAPAHLFCEECAASTDHSVCWRNRTDFSCVWCAQGVSCPVHCGL
jgi:hypothetical protein